MAAKKRTRKSKASRKGAAKPSGTKAKKAATKGKRASATKATKPKKRPGSDANPDRSALLWMVGALLAFGVVGVVVMAQPSTEGADPDRIVEDVEVPPAAGGGAVTIPEALRAHVVRRLPHDPDAFTQGLLLHEGKLYESTGLEGRSSLRRVDLETGRVEQRVEVPETYFAEGLARVDDRLVQLTWQNGRAFVYDLDSFEKVGEFEYEGEGWGLCYDGTHLVMSDGSDRLTFRDPETFEVRRSVRVTRIGRPVRQLNELECVDGQVWANVWQRNELVRIDPRDGTVTAIADASGLLTRAERRETDVLNGIVALPNGNLLLTGKLWPAAFEVELRER